MSRRFTGRGCSGRRPAPLTLLGADGAGAATPAQIDGFRVELGGQCGQPVGGRRLHPGVPGRLQPRRGLPGPAGLRQQGVGLLRDRRRLPGLRPGHRGRRHVERPAVRLPADRRRAVRRSPTRSGSTAQQVENLRLSGETLAKIFTNQITNWDDPEITKDNNGVALPSMPIVPVVQSEGSGATQQLTDYFATEYPEHLAVLRRAVWTDRVFPPSGGPDRPERLERGDELHGVERRPTGPSATSSTRSP